MVKVDTRIIEKIVDEEVANSKAPGVAFGLYNDQGLIIGKNYGHCNLEDNAEVDLDTCFMIGSITKLFTIIALMQQYEKGNFKLNDDINDYLPDGKVQLKKGWPPVSILNLMTHTSGIGELRRFRDVFKKGFRLLTYDDVPVPPLKTFHELPVYPASPAGMKHAYSNVGASILGYLVEIFSGTSFRDYLIKNIFDPLQMHNTDLIRSDRILDNEALGYKYKKEKYERAKRWNNIISPSGAAVSTVNDMAKFGACLLNKDNLLKSSTYDLMWTPKYYAAVKLKERYSMGLIFWLHHVNDHLFIQHTGSVMGFNAAFGFFPDDNIGYFTCCNLQEGLHHRLTYRIRNRIVKYITNLQNNFHYASLIHPSVKNKLKGHYGGYPGFLSNTRVITEGINFKIKEKKDHLTFSGIIGPQSKGEKLFPTEDPHTFVSLHKDDGDYLYYTKKYVFKENKKGNILEFDRTFDKYRKLKWYQTFRFKLLAFIGIIALITFLISITL